MLIKVIIYIIYTIICSFIIQSLLERKLSFTINSNSSLIGFSERLLYLIVLVSGEYQLITGVLLVKTIIRFPEINQHNGSNMINAEKYILGTMLNLIAAVFSLLII